MHYSQAVSNDRDSSKSQSLAWNLPGISRFSGRLELSIFESVPDFETASSDQP